jgi:hypothetical protein
VDCEQQHQIGAHEDAIEQPAQGRGREDLADRRVAVEPHHQVADAAVLEERERQPQQVVQEVEGEPQIEIRLEVQEQQRPQVRVRETEDDQNDGAGRQHCEEVHVAAWHHHVDDGAR